MLSIPHNTVMDLNNVLGRLETINFTLGVRYMCISIVDTSNSTNIFDCWIGWFGNCLIKLVYRNNRKTKGMIISMNFIYELTMNYYLILPCWAKLEVPTLLSSCKSMCEYIKESTQPQSSFATQQLRLTKYLLVVSRPNELHKI